MEGGLFCTVCNEVYDFDVHRPKALPCGHTFCLDCLNKIYEMNGRLVCPLDNLALWKKAETFPDNQAIKDMLEPLQVRCCKHTSEIAKKFCLVHMMEICNQCQHQRPTCSIKDTIEDRVEITQLVFSRIEKLQREASLISREMRSQLDHRFGSTLTKLVKLMHAMEQNLALKCTQCGGEAAFFPHSDGRWTLCTLCLQNLTPGEDCGLESIGDLCQVEVSKILMLRLAIFLKTINFCDVPREILDALKASNALEPKSIMDLYQCLTTYRPRIQYEDLPDRFICPGCLESYEKASDYMRELPCMPQLHALCDQCLVKMEGGPIRCPLDGNEFHKPLENLPKLGPSGPSDYHQPTSNSDKSQPPVSPFMPMPQFNWTPPRKQEPPVIPVQESRPRSTKLPPASVPPGFSYLDRFTSVLPEFGTSLSLHHGNNKGWILNPNKNQVEVFNFSVFDPVLLAGLALSTPIVPGVLVRVEFLKILQGQQVVFNNPGGQELLGGNSFCLNIYFQQPFRVIPCTQYTLKIKLRAAGPVAEGPVMLYRGCPYDRPGWAGSDLTQWHFEETSELAVGEYSSGQGNLSGPVLRFYYTKQS